MGGYGRQTMKSQKRKLTVGRPLLREDIPSRCLVTFNSKLIRLPTRLLMSRICQMTAQRRRRQVTTNYPKQSKPPSALKHDPESSVYHASLHGDCDEPTETANLRSMAKRRMVKVAMQTAAIVRLART
ncbi:hypothetical protein M514_01585 [Trichuris suis]|uniref:Uncharacterized protein n=1 Tax=Trichuris suis TaxID=68888 RepID=A0A085NAU1_9BILA|nr:hypothetical protein M514_01585 [Trichuris suis]